MDPAAKAANKDEEKGNATRDSRSNNDPASKMWALCVSHADKLDTAMVEGWKADMDGILIYTGVFSATVAAFLIESYKLLRPDSSESTARLLQQVTQELAAISNGTPSPSPVAGEAFKPKSFAVHVNILWFLSLCISLSCALAATLVQQWARRYLRLAQQQTVLQRRVRIRTYLFEGIEIFHARWLVENISLLMHAAIFLFFAGLVEFLFNINHEVARVVLVVVSVFAVTYVVLTALPVIFRQCPFQTPLSSLLWYLGYVFVVGCLSVFAWSNHTRVKIEGFWRHLREGIDNHLAQQAELSVKIDQKALRSVLRSCREDSEVEAFLDAIPGYLRAGDGNGSHIANIGMLLNDEEGGDAQLGQRIVQLFASCVDADGRMDKAARRRRAITCARATWVISRAFLSERLNLELADYHSASKILRRLAHDHDPEVAFAALCTIAISERALLEQLSRSESKSEASRPLEQDYDFDHGQAREIIEALAELLGEPDPLSTRYHHRHNHDQSMKSAADGDVDDHHRYPPDARLIALTEFISNVLPLVPHLTELSHEDLDVVRKTITDLCEGLDGNQFSDSAQRGFVEVLSEASKERDKAVRQSTGLQSSRSRRAAYYSTIVSSTQSFVKTLDARYIDMLR